MSSAPPTIRLGFVTARSFSVNRGVWTETSLARLLELLAKRSSGLTVAGSVSPVRQPLHDCQVAVREEDFLPLPWLPSVRRGFEKFPGCRRVIRQVEARSDVLLVQLAFAAPLALLGARTPRVYHICGDIEASVRSSPWYRGPKGVAARALATLFHLVQRRLVQAKNARVVANGAALFEKYGRKGRAVVSSSLLASEMGSVARQRPRGAPFRVLYVGHFRHEKGIDVLLDAFARLLGELGDAELMIVGAEHSDAQNVLTGAGHLFQDLKSKGRLSLSGALPFGPGLFQCIADADVLALPSRSEGTPRVLVEARAFGCPIVASRVGGVPSSVEDGVDGLLVPPGDVQALCEALLRVARDAELRARLVSNGKRSAAKLTVERFAAEMWDEIELCVREAAEWRRPTLESTASS